MKPGVGRLAYANGSVASSPHDVPDETISRRAMIVARVEKPSIAWPAQRRGMSELLDNGLLVHIDLSEVLVLARRAQRSAKPQGKSPPEAVPQRGVRAPGLKVIHAFTSRKNAARLPQVEYRLYEVHRDVSRHLLHWLQTPGTPPRLASPARTAGLGTAKVIATRCDGAHVLRGVRKNQAAGRGVWDEWEEDAANAEHFELAQLHAALTQGIPDCRCVK